MEITTLSQYMDHVQANCGPEVVLFRGQGVDKPLLPKVARKDFRPRGDRLVVEKRMLDDFKRQAPPLLRLQPESSWEWLAVAQHYGMATRLLDWTLNSLAALWFAVERPAARGTACGVVWYFEVQEADYVTASHKDPFGASRTRVFRPRHLADRITAQAGWFTAHRYLEGKEPVPLDRNKYFRNRLVKLAIPVGSFPSIRRELDRCGVNAAALLGGVDGLCRQVEWVSSLLEDEEDPALAS